MEVAVARSLEDATGRKEERRAVAAAFVESERNVREVAARHKREARELAAAVAESKQHIKLEVGRCRLGAIADQDQLDAEAAERLQMAETKAAGSTTKVKFTGLTQTSQVDPAV
jgi:hypothetical protein